MRSVILLAVAIAVSGCTVRTHGHQSTSGGATTVVTSSAVSGSATVGNARVAFSSGRPVPVSAPGGHLSLSGDAAGALLIGVILLDAVNYLAAQSSAPPGVRQRPIESISHTCSCYGYQDGPAPAKP